MKVFLLTAAHQTTPGIVTKIFATRELANIEAAILVNLMLNDEDGSEAVALPDDWEMVLDGLIHRLDLEPNDPEEPYVEISEMEVIGA